MSSILPRSADQRLNLASGAAVEVLKAKKDEKTDPATEVRSYLAESAEAMDQLGLKHPDGGSWQEDRPTRPPDKYPV